ncbi:hypothetical protein [Butyrivibrio sp. WCE2006]|uniref:hypothetical protein n=1 Tax=Butyrivibrio sp. WCE2006 TaxID=1410611 RepID=UPI0005D1DF27|nr:hypothetical protein [Butyrivibrio sp. WCE2006]
MNDDFKYLSDDDLNSLIESTEKAGLLEPPINFEAEVLKRLERAEMKSTVSFEDKKREYKKFRFQVCMAMAAAVLFLIVSPFISESDSINAIKAQVVEKQTSERIRTNYVSAILGNHVMSETMTGCHFDKDKED